MKEMTLRFKDHPKTFVWDTFLTIHHTKKKNKEKVFRSSIGLEHCFIYFFMCILCVLYTQKISFLKIKHMCRKMRKQYKNYVNRRLSIYIQGHDQSVPIILAKVIDFHYFSLMYVHVYIHIRHSSRKLLHQGGRLWGLNKNKWIM